MIGIKKIEGLGTECLLPITPFSAEDILLLGTRALRFLLGMHHLPASWQRTHESFIQLLEKIKSGDHGELHRLVSPGGIENTTPSPELVQEHLISCAGADVPLRG
jgi:hypothetical protein